MAYVRIFLTVLLSLMLSRNKSGAASSQFENVYVSLYGEDCKSCGSLDLPCQSIAQAVRQVDKDGIIFLNGSGTKQNPFYCSPPHQGNLTAVEINKSLTMKGFYSTPHVFCVKGFHFEKANDGEQTLRFELSGIAFWQTPLTFENCHHVKIVNCSFHNAPRAMSIRIRNITTFRLDIQGFSSFHNNSHCIHLIFLENFGNKSRRFVNINISGTHFIQNGLHGVQRSERGVMKISSKEDKTLKQVDIDIFCEKVKCAKNQGPFINLNVSTAVTNETYKDVELSFNKLPSWKDSLDRKQKLTVHSLYFSHTKRTRAKFVKVECYHNPSVQCIKVQSDEADIDIQDSYFHKQSTLQRAGSCLSLEADIRASLQILNTTFWKNEADAGGSIYVDSPGGFVDVNVTNVRFSKCSARKYGCAISVGKPLWRGHHNQSCPDKLYFNLKNVTIEQWKGKWSKCTAALVYLKGGKVTIEESRFHKKTRTTVEGALKVVNTGGKTNVTVSKCSFIDKAAKARTGFIFIHLVAGNGHAGFVTFADSSIVGNTLTKKRKALLISPKYRIKLVNITLIQFRYGFQVNSSPPKNSSFPVDIVIDYCTFINNVYDVLLVIKDPTSVQVIIKNTIFSSSSKETVENDGETYAVRITIPPLKNITSSKATIELDNNTFDARPSSRFALFFEGDKNVTVRRTLFQNCINAHPYNWFVKEGEEFVYETATGAISILTSPDKSQQLGCIRQKATHEIHPTWNYDCHVLFEDTIFVENVGLAAGAVYISNGYTRFRRCTFRDNFGTHRTGHVYSAYGTGQVDFEDCSFSRTKKSKEFSNISTFNKPTFLYSESGGPVKLKNTSMISLDPDRNSFPMIDITSGGYVDMDEASKLQCSEGQELLLDNATHIVFTEKNNSFCRLNVTVLRYYCRSCPPGYYSLQKGVSRGLVVATAVLCIPCSFGANCVKSNIAAKPNFWGYQASNHPPKLEFIACPEHYCQSSESADYNSCHGNRNGTLCGQCADGFTETLFSAECCKYSKCNNYTVWILTMVLTVALVLYLLIKPPILSLLGTQILWFKRKAENHSRDDLGLVEDREHSDSGYIKITFYFYQAAELLMVGSIEDCLQKIPFIHFVIAAFNFQVRTINNGIGCPFIGLTAVTKQLVLSGTVFVTMFEVVIIYCFHATVNMLRGKEKPHLIHYMAVVMEVLLLGYERLAETSLTLMHCVSIGSGKWLFIDASVPCMQWWQYILLAYIIVFVVPFVVVLYYGSSKLYKASVTASEFLAACMIPLPFLIYWLVKDMLRRRGTRGNSTSVQVVNRDVLEILHGPFRKPNNDDGGTLYWESVLIGRRLILLACQAFITNLMLRMVCMVGACFLMTIHHVLKNPFRDLLANRAETLSLTALSIIAVINLAKATLIAFGISFDGPDTPYFEALEWFEACALAFVPALVSLLVTFAILSQLTRLLVFLIKKCRHTRWQIPSHTWLIDQLREPLLDVAEQNIAEQNSDDDA